MAWVMISAEVVLRQEKYLKLFLTSFPEGTGACQSLESDPTMEGKSKAEAKSELDAEVAVDIENQEMESDSFPSPVDPWSDTLSALPFAFLSHIPHQNWSEK